MKGLSIQRDTANKHTTGVLHSLLHKRYMGLFFMALGVLLFVDDWSFILFTDFDYVEVFALPIFLLGLVTYLIARGEKSVKKYIQLSLLSTGFYLLLYNTVRYWTIKNDDLFPPIIAYNNRWIYFIPDFWSLIGYGSYLGIIILAVAIPWLMFSARKRRNSDGGIAK